MLENITINSALLVTSGGDIDGGGDDVSHGTVVATAEHMSPTYVTAPREVSLRL